MKKLYAVSYLLILCTTHVNGHNPEVVNWDHKTFDTFSGCMSGTIDERTQDGCTNIIKEWVKANGKNIEDSTTIDTIEIAPKKSNDCVKIRIKTKEYDQNIRKLSLSSKKNNHNNPFIDKDKQCSISKYIPEQAHYYHSGEQDNILKYKLCYPELSYDMANPVHLKRLYIPYALKYLDKRIENNINYLNILHQKKVFIPHLLELSNYPGNTQNPQEINSMFSQLNSNLDKLPKSCNQTLNYHIDNVKTIKEKQKSGIEPLNDPTKIQNALRSIPPALLLMNQEIQSHYQFNKRLWYKLRPYLLDNLWYCAAINASPALLEEASSSNDDPKQYSNTISPYEKLSNKTALELAEEMEGCYCNEEDDTFYNREECKHRHEFVKMFKTKLYKRFLGRKETEKCIKQD